MASRGTSPSEDRTPSALSAALDDETFEGKTVIASDVEAWRVAIERFISKIPTAFKARASDEITAHLLKWSKSESLSLLIPSFLAQTLPSLTYSKIDPEEEGSFAETLSNITSLVDVSISIGNRYLPILASDDREFVLQSTIPLLLSKKKDTQLNQCLEAIEQTIYSFALAYRNKSAFSTGISKAARISGAYLRSSLPSAFGDDVKFDPRMLQDFGRTCHRCCKSLRGDSATFLGTVIPHLSSTYRFDSRDKSWSSAMKQIRSTCIKLRDYYPGYQSQYLEQIFPSVFESLKRAPTLPELKELGESLVSIARSLGRMEKTSRPFSFRSKQLRRWRRSKQPPTKLLADSLLEFIRSTGEHCLLGLKVVAESLEYMEPEKARKWIAELTDLYPDFSRHLMSKKVPPAKIQELHLRSVLAALALGNGEDRLFFSRVVLPLTEHLGNRFSEGTFEKSLELVEKIIRSVGKVHSTYLLKSLFPRILRSDDPLDTLSRVEQECRLSSEHSGRYFDTFARLTMHTGSDFKPARLQQRKAQPLSFRYMNNFLEEVDSSELLAGFAAYETAISSLLKRSHVLAAVVTVRGAPKIARLLGKGGVAPHFSKTVSMLADFCFSHNSDEQLPFNRGHFIFGDFLDTFDKSVSGDVQADIVKEIHAGFVHFEQDGFSFVRNVMWHLLRKNPAPNGGALNLTPEGVRFVKETVHDTWLKLDTNGGVLLDKTLPSFLKIGRERPTPQQLDSFCSFVLSICEKHPAHAKQLLEREIPEIIHAYGQPLTGSEYHDLSKTLDRIVSLHEQISGPEISNHLLSASEIQLLRKLGYDSIHCLAHAALFCSEHVDFEFHNALSFASYSYPSFSATLRKRWELLGPHINPLFVESMRFSLSLPAEKLRDSSRQFLISLAGNRSIGGDTAKYSESLSIVRSLLDRSRPQDSEALLTDLFPLLIGKDPEKGAKTDPLRYLTLIDSTIDSLNGDSSTFLRRSLLPILKAKDLPLTYEELQSVCKGAVNISAKLRTHQSESNEAENGIIGPFIEKIAGRSQLIIPILHKLASDADSFSPEELELLLTNFPAWEYQTGTSAGTEVIIESFKSALAGVSNLSAESRASFFNSTFPLLIRSFGNSWKLTDFKNVLSKVVSISHMLPPETECFYHENALPALLSFVDGESPLPILKDFEALLSRAPDSASELCRSVLPAMKQYVSLCKPKIRETFTAKCEADTKYRRSHRLSQELLQCGVRVYNVVGPHFAAAALERLSLISEKERIEITSTDWFSSERFKAIALGEGLPQGAVGNFFAAVLSLLDSPSRSWLSGEAAFNILVARQTEYESHHTKNKFACPPIEFTVHFETSLFDIEGVQLDRSKLNEILTRFRTLPAGREEEIRKTLSNSIYEAPHSFSGTNDSIQGEVYEYAKEILCDLAEDPKQYCEVLVDMIPLFIREHQAIDREEALSAWTDEELSGLLDDFLNIDLDDLLNDSGVTLDSQFHFRNLLRESLGKSFGSLISVSEESDEDEMFSKIEAIVYAKGQARVTNLRSLSNGTPSSSRERIEAALKSVQHDDEAFLEIFRLSLSVLADEAGGLDVLYQNGASELLSDLKIDKTRRSRLIELLDPILMSAIDAEISARRQDSREEEISKFRELLAMQRNHFEEKYRGLLRVKQSIEDANPQEIEDRLEKAILQCGGDTERALDLLEFSIPLLLKDGTSSLAPERHAVVLLRETLENLLEFFEGDVPDLIDSFELPKRNRVNLLNASRSRFSEVRAFLSEQLSRFPNEEKPEDRTLILCGRMGLLDRIYHWNETDEDKYFQDHYTIPLRFVDKETLETFGSLTVQRVSHNGKILLILSRIQGTLSFVGTVHQYSFVRALSEALSAFAVTNELEGDFYCLGRKDDNDFYQDAFVSALEALYGEEVLLSDRERNNLRMEENQALYRLTIESRSSAALESNHLSE